jgi:histidine triad (HIT) family protein
MDSDIFCKIVNKEIPARIIYETADTLAMLDIIPSSPGHSVVILKKHGDSILEYSDNELMKLMVSIKVVVKKIESVLNPDSITIGINHKEKRGVPHLHIHLIPRWDNDKGSALQGVVHNPVSESLDALSLKLENA